MEFTELLVALERHYELVRGTSSHGTARASTRACTAIRTAVGRAGVRILVIHGSKVIWRAARASGVLAGFDSNYDTKCAQQ